MKALRAMLGLLLAAVLLLFPQAASAHARLTASTPAPGSALGTMPAQLTLAFSESVDPSYSSATLLAADGSAIPTGTLSLAPGTNTGLVVPITNANSAPPGVYTLVWRVLSATDGHVTNGTLAFSVGSGATPISAVLGNETIRPPWWRVAIRWFEIAALVIAAGGFFFSASIGRDLTAARLRLALAIASGGAVLALLLSLHDQAILVAGRRFFDPPPLSVYRSVIFDTSGGRGWLARLALALVMLVLSRWAFTGRRAIAPELGVIAGGLALFARSRTGHAAGSGHEWLAIAADWLHLATVAIWFGGLVFVALAKRTIAAPSRARLLLIRFSQLALASMAVLIAAGLTSAALEVAGARSLRSTDYGRVLIAKHATFAPVLVAAGVNLLLIVPRLRRATEPERQASLLASARRVVWIELAFGALVLIAAGALTELAPANGPLTVDVASRITTVNQSAPAGDLTVHLLSVLTGEPTDRYVVTVTDANGNPPANLQRLIVVSKDASNPTIGDRFDAEPVANTPGSFAFPATRIGLATTWDLDLIVRRAGVNDVTGSTQVDVRDAAVQPPRLVDDQWRWPRLTWMSWLLAPLALVLLVGGIIGVRKLPGLEPVAGGVALAMTGLIAAGFMIQAIRSTMPVTPGTDLTSPVVNDPGAVIRGGQTYASYCLACHGSTGEGVNIANSVHSHGASAGLLGAPAKRGTDGDLYWRITKGVAGTEMPAYDHALTDAERWDLVAYVRQLQAADGRTIVQGAGQAVP